MLDPQIRQNFDPIEFILSHFLHNMDSSPLIEGDFSLSSNRGANLDCGLYRNATIPAGKNNANGKIPKRPMPISTTTETIKR